jgi:hypothetical protein
MPWRFGIPLMSSSAILHWTLSQSVFVMVVEAVAEDGTIDHKILNILLASAFGQLLFVSGDAGFYSLHPFLLLFSIDC